MKHSTNHLSLVARFSGGLVDASVGFDVTVVLFGNTGSFVPRSVAKMTRSHSPLPLLLNTYDVLVKYNDQAKSQ